MSPKLLYVFEKDPVLEAAALSALAAGFRHDVLPAHVMSRGESRSTSRTSASSEASFPSGAPCASCASSSSFARKAAS